MVVYETAFPLVYEKIANDGLLCRPYAACFS